jgi:transcription elongation factor GreA
MARTVRVTKDGYERLKSTLETERKRLEDAIKILQDVSGSSDDYDDTSLEEAKNEKNLIELRVDDLEDQLARAEIIETRKVDKVGLGTVITLRDNATQEAFEIQLVSSIEAGVVDLEIPKVSDESPLGQAVNNLKVGSNFKVSIGKKTTDYTVVALN